MDDLRKPVSGGSVPAPATATATGMPRWRVILLDELGLQDVLGRGGMGTVHRAEFV